MDIQQSSFPFQVFRAYDIRGKVTLLTPELVQAVALGLAVQIKNTGSTREIGRAHV